MALAAEIDPDAPVVFAALDTDTREWDTETVDISNACEEWMRCWHLFRLDELKEWLEDGTQPEPEYNPGDWQCRSCPFLTVCGNVEPEPAGPCSHGSRVCRRGTRIPDC